MSDSEPHIFLFFSNGSYIEIPNAQLDAEKREITFLFDDTFLTLWSALLNLENSGDYFCKTFAIGIYNNRNDTLLKTLGCALAKLEIEGCADDIIVCKIRYKSVGEKIVSPFQFQRIEVGQNTYYKLTPDAFTINGGALAIHRFKIAIEYPSIKMYVVPENKRNAIPIFTPCLPRIEGGFFHSQGVHVQKENTCEIQVQNRNGRSGRLRIEKVHECECCETVESGYPIMYQTVFKKEQGVRGNVEFQ